MRKKLFAILMSAMMMVTFMPAMAFAGSVADYRENVTITVDNYATVKAVYTVDASTKIDVSVKADQKFNTSTGTVQVFANQAELFAKLADSSKYNTAVETGITVADVFKDVLGSDDVLDQYYDLTDSTLAHVNTAIPSNLTAAEFQGIYDNTLSPRPYEFTGIIVYEPADLYAARKAVNPSVTRGERYLTALYGYKTLAIKALAEGAFDPKSKDAQTVELEVVPVVNNPANCYPIEAGVIKHTYNIGAGTLTAQDAEFFFDEVKSTKAVPMTSYAYAPTPALVFDGAEHTIVMKELAGYGVTYKKFNTANGKWEAADAITYKDAAALYKYVATVKSTDATKAATATGKQDYTFDFKVETADVNAGFDTTWRSEVKQTVYEGDAYDPYDFIVFTAGNTSDINEKAAVAAGLDSLKAYVKALYTVTATPDSYNAKIVKLTVNKKTTTLTDEEKALVKAVAANYNVATIAENTTAYLTIKDATLDNEIDFIGAVKKIKAGKSAKIKAETLSGAAVTFKKLSGNSKIKVSAAGKVSVKKSLKKGTYKVKVKATVAAGKGYKRATATKVYKIKVR